MVLAFQPLNFMVNLTRSKQSVVWLQLPHLPSTLSEGSSPFRPGGTPLD